MSFPFFEELTSVTDLWQTLTAERRDILLYGMGNGADKILRVLEKKGVRVAGVFASDGFVRGHAFHGMPVRSFSDVCATYPPGECVVLLAFGSARPEVLALIERVAARYPLFVPDVPVCGDTLFDAAFFSLHKGELCEARALLCDDESRRIFDLVLAYKLTGRLDLLLSACHGEDRARQLLELHTVRSMADLGAYNGDTIKEMQTVAPLCFALAAEPDRRNFKKLSAWAKTADGLVIEAHAVAVLDRIGEACFDASGNRNAGLATGHNTKGVTVATSTPDALLSGRPVDYIKYDVEGAEAAALIGSRDTLATHSPRLRIACYHRSEDLFSLPLLLRDLVPGYRLFLTRRRSLPAWDLDLLALP
ncbi:MAG: FkbM family methyltransferase [Ruminococcaceae bacterium]|nr:FkbM family methyltransferase [Oscillospiraceae bacterium]